MAEHRIEAHGASYRIEADPESLIGRKIASGIPYEQPLLEHVYEQHFEGVALDIGASIGNHSLYLAAVCGLQVHAFEPLEIDPLWHNVLLNPELDITVYPHALGAQDTSATSLGKGRLEVGGEGIAVRPLDFYELAPSVVKIDVEDMECDVLRGAEQTIREHRPVLYTEARDRKARLAQAAILEPWGYEVTLAARTATRVLEWRAA